MPAYYNPYMNAYPINYSGSVYPVQQVPQQPQYMINVDGELAAKSWQSPTVPQPNSIIPLFDLDGQHVYFKSYDNYGRMNPLRKGRIVFDDEVVQQSETAAPDLSKYATTELVESMYKELKDILDSIREQQPKTNQNGTNNRGEKK